jgi:hypothetical protein
MQYNSRSGLLFWSLFFRHLNAVAGIQRNRRIFGKEHKALKVWRFEDLEWSDICRKKARTNKYNSCNSMSKHSIWKMRFNKK